MFAAAARVFVARRCYHGLCRPTAASAATARRIAPYFASGFSTDAQEKDQGTTNVHDLRPTPLSDRLAESEAYIDAVMDEVEEEKGDEDYMPTEEEWTQIDLAGTARWASEHGYLAVGDDDDDDDAVDVADIPWNEWSTEEEDLNFKEIVEKNDDDDDVGFVLFCFFVCAECNVAVCPSLCCTVIILITLHCEGGEANEWRWHRLARWLPVSMQR